MPTSTTIKIGSSLRGIRFLKAANTPSPIKIKAAPVLVLIKMSMIKTAIKAAPTIMVRAAIVFRFFMIIIFKLASYQSTLGRKCSSSRSRPMMSWMTSPQSVGYLLGMSSR